MENTKSFKYSLKSKSGKVILQSIVTFGSDEQPFPKDWENDSLIQLDLQRYKEKFIQDNFDILIDEDLEFDI